MTYRRTIAALWLTASAPTAFAQTAPYFPGAAWEHRAPAQVGLSAAWIDSAVAYARFSETTAPRDQLEAHDKSGFGREPLPTPIGPMKERGDMTGIIVRHGYIVAEWGEPDRVDMTHSVTKSFLSTVVGLAFDRGMAPAILAIARLRNSTRIRTERRTGRQVGRRRTVVLGSIERNIPVD